MHRFIPRACIRSLHIARNPCWTIPLARRVCPHASQGHQSLRIHTYPPRLSTSTGKDDPTAPEKLRRVLRKVPFPVTVITTCSPSDPSIRRGITVSSFSSISLQPDALIAFCVKLPSRVSTLLHESNRFVVQFLAQDQIPHSVAFSSSGAPKKKKKRAEEDLELEGTSAGQVLSEAAKQTLKPDSSPISEKQSGSLSSSSSSSTVASTTTTSSPPLAFSEEDPDPFLVLGHKTDPETGIPVLEGTMGAVRCRTHKVMVVGDHEMWIGHVEKVLYGSAMVEDSVQTMEGATPIEQQELWVQDEEDASQKAPLLYHDRSYRKVGRRIL